MQWKQKLCGQNSWVETSFSDIEMRLELITFFMYTVSVLTEQALIKLRFKNRNLWLKDTFKLMFNPRSLEGGGGAVKLTSPRFFWLEIFAPCLIVKSFGTTVPCLWTHLLTQFRWRRISNDVIAKSHAICVLTSKSQFLARNLLNTYNFTMDSTYFVDFNS